MMRNFYVIKATKLLLWTFVFLFLVLLFWGILDRVEGVSPVSLWSQFGMQRATTQEVVLVTTPQVKQQEERASVVATKVAPTRFSEYRLERERTRSKQIELLDGMIGDITLSNELRTQAMQELVMLMNFITKEAEIENLLKAKGYVDAVVILDERSLTLILPVNLTGEEVQVIGSVVHRITGVPLEGITIIDDPRMN